MFIEALILIAGLILILVGAEFLVEGSSSIAKKFGVSEFVIGLTIVGIGTSTPEMVVSFLSAFEGKASMAIGNVIGSNIFNTALILGVTAMISPLIITRNNMKRDIPLNIIATILLIALGMNHTLFKVGTDTLTRIDGIIFLLLFSLYIFFSFKNDTEDSDEEHTEEKPRTIAMSSIMIVSGLAGLIWGGNLFVNSATELAKLFGVSDKFIAITIMAGGTSLPELATCVVAALKGRGQLALGNILGSNISNILLILGGSALISPLSFGEITNVDIGVVLLCAIIILLTALVLGKNKITRTEGLVLVIIEIAYMTYLIANV